MADTIILKIDLQNEAQVIEGLKNIDKLADKLRGNPVTIKVDTSALNTMGQMSSQTQKAAAKQAAAQDKSNKAMKDGAKSAGLLGDRLDRIIAKVAAWQVINAGVAAVKRSFTEALGTMKDVDTELTTIQKVTDMSDAALKKLGDTAYSTASKYGVAADEYLQNVGTFSKAGYKELAQGLGELAIKTQLVGDVNAETASKFLLSTDAAYKYNGSVEALSAVLDKANAVENNYATTIEIHFDVTINLNGEALTRLCTKLTQRLPIAFRKFLQGHFDGEGDISLTTYQLSGAPSDLAEALRLLRQELGDEAPVDVRYHCSRNQFERNHLTLLSAEQIADNESRL